MTNEPIVIDKFLHIINQRKIADAIQFTDLKWTLNLFPSYGTKFAHVDFEKSDTEMADSPALFHRLYLKGTETDISMIDTPTIMNSFQKSIEKQINAKIEILKCMLITVVPNPNFTAQSMLPHVDTTIPHETCIYYINSTDGDTVLFDQKYDPSLSKHDNDNKKKTEHSRITPVQGKAVLFDGLRYHASNPSKTDLRFVLNINYVRV
jgi:hypothetical protein